jgi:hypothetical protein
MTHPEDNELLAFCKSYEEAARAEFTITRLCCWIIAWGLAMVGAIALMHLS